MEKELVERDLMSENEFESYLVNNRSLVPRLFTGVGRFKSIRRAIKRGLASQYGELYPKRPFNNRKPTLGRAKNELKKEIYGQIKASRIQ